MKYKKPATKLEEEVKTLLVYADEIEGQIKYLQNVLSNQLSYNLMRDDRVRRAERQIWILYGITIALSIGLLLSIR